MHLAANVFDVWAFQRRADGVVFLLLYTSVEKAARHFNGGRFWQIPCDSVNEGESIVDAAAVLLEPSQHSEYTWLPFDTCLERVHYRGLKDGLRSVHEYVTGVESPAKELCLFRAPGG